MSAAALPPRRAVFLDRDGTLNVDTGYVSKPEDVVLVPRAAEGAAMLEKAGFVLVIASNQSAIARGMLTEEEADAVDRQVRRLLHDKGVNVEAVYRCPHLPEAAIKEFAVECDCRKPRPGLLLRAARELNVNLQNSWAVGDRPRDVEAGIAAGCRTIAVRSAGPAHVPGSEHFPAGTLLVDDLVAAANVILAS